MGRKEDRKLKKLKGESLRSPKVDYDKLLNPMIIGDTKYIPVVQDNMNAPVNPDDNDPGIMTVDEFRERIHQFSDKEMNRIIYQNAKMAVEGGYMPDRPEDDFGTVVWFTWNFITPEMRMAFPAIAKEFLAHFRTADDTIAAVPKEFDNIPYPRMNETTWQGYGAGGNPEVPQKKSIWRVGA